MQKTDFFVRTKIVNIIGCLIAAQIFTYDANALTDNGFTGAGGYCLYKDNGFNCAWCSTGGAQAGNCKKGYAGCQTSATVENSGKNITINGETSYTTWTCGESGWTALTYTNPTTCDRYSYKNSSGECVMCPYPDFVYADTESPVFPRGDNWEYKLTGCNVQILPTQYYKDETGTFTNGAADSSQVQCFHSGTL